MIVVTPSESQVFTAVRSFLTDVLPAGTEVVRGMVNRVPEPRAANFVVMWPLRQPRLSTNLDTFSDATYRGAIASGLLTVSSVLTGSPNLAVGAHLWFPGNSDGVEITELGTGTGGVGTYEVRPPLTVSETTMASGGCSFTQHTELVVQLDVHGPLSADNAVKITTLFNDEYGVTSFERSGFPVIPLYHEDTIQSPFIGAEKQYENRHILQLHVQVNQTVSNVPQQFADTVSVELIDVDANYPVS